MPLLRSVVSPAVIVVVAAVAMTSACSSSDSSSEETLSFKDARGRSCTKRRDGPPVATCDQPPAPSVACAAGSSACYTVDPGLDTNEEGRTVSSKTVIKNCAACCKDGDNSASTSSKDCVVVTCTTPADCLGYSQAACNNGRCEL